MKQFFKIVAAVVCLGMAFLFGAMVGNMAIGVYIFRDWGMPRIHSERYVRSRYFAIPADASRIYYSCRGFPGQDHFLAFTASEAQIEAFLQRQVSTSLASFKPIGAIPQSTREHGPQSWDYQYQDDDWDLSDAGDLLALTKDSEVELFYSRKLSRLFVCEWGD